MITLNGHSTSVVKIQLESVISYNLGLISDVGKFEVTAAGSGDYTADPDYTLPTSGENLVLRCTSGVKSTTNIGVTIVGTDQSSAAVTGQVTIPAGVAEGQSFNVVPTVDGKRFKTITSVTISGGVFGDGFELCVLPPEANDVEIGFDQGLTTNVGKEVKPIYRKYDLDHNKRVRGERTLSLSAFYTNNLEGLARINNRDVTIRQDFKDDGQASATEVIYIDTCRLGITRESPSADDGECQCKGEGTYGRLFMFS